MCHNNLHYNITHLLLILVLFLPTVLLFSKFTNLHCEDHDLKFSRFEKYKLKVLRRGLVVMNINVNLYQTPVTNISINVGLYKRANGYRPFLWNISQDACLFFARQNRFPVLKFMLGLITEHSNINHTCPYNINVGFYKRANGYRPFLWNITEDVCQFFDRRSRYPVLKFAFNFFWKYSNLNQTCPFNISCLNLKQDIIVKDLILEDKYFQMARFPMGQYLFKMKVFAYNDLKATVSVYVSITE
ncbi:uncharacterized protein LOC111679419 [Lucilia cuprina]|uniref:uncharacterized protein LOC111679419 n=1 Tax=Lucilia cuprina TaxID=7375 RepID=UPI001F05A045|nr:uncharacterized protein LOC111679419 [Lucilia cuprina]